MHKSKRVRWHYLVLLAWLTYSAGVLVWFRLQNPVADLCIAPVSGGK
jgi:hypothetical protein